MNSMGMGMSMDIGLGESGGHVPAFQITGVSQSAGTVNGGSVVTVTAIGIQGTPTSTLGAVSAVTASTFNITTNAHAAGGFAWTATNGLGGSTAPGGTFTYLANPAISGVSPNNGPQTLTTAGVVITCSGLPPGGSGVTVMATVDGNAITGLVIGATTVTGTFPTDTSSGAKNVVVTVDGVASTGGANAWTYNPPPSVTDAEQVSTSGGTSTVDGSNFVATPTASVNINGTPTSLGVAFVSGTQLTMTLAAGSYTAGNWDLTVTNPDGQLVTAPGVFSITSVQTPETIFGANLVADWIPSNAVLSGGIVQSIADSSGSGNNLSVTSNAGVTQFTNDSAFLMSGVTTIAHNGTTGYLACSALAMGTGGTIYVIVCGVMVGSTSTNQCAASYISGGANNVQQSSGNQWQIATGTGTATDTQFTAVNNPATVVAGWNKTGAGTGQVSIVLNNNQEFDASVTGTILNSQQLTVGARFNGATYDTFATMRWARICVVNVKPSGSQMLAIAKYMNATYGVTNPPTVTRVSQVAAATSGAALRILGSGFMANMTANVILSGTATPITLSAVNYATAADFTTPSLAAGTYDIQVTNPDGRSRTLANAVTVSSATTPMSIFGLICIGDFDLAHATLNGSAVSGLIDQSCMGNDIAQSTGANQPSYSASDANFNNKPSMTGNGTSDYLISSGASVLLDNTTMTGFAILAVFRPGSTGALRSIASCRPSTQTWYLQVDSTGHLTFYGGAQVTEAAALSGTQNVYGTGITGAGGTGTVAVNHDTATATSAAATVGVPQDGGSFYALSNTVAQFGNGSIARIILLNANPTAGQLSSWESYCQSQYGAA